MQFRTIDEIEPGGENRLLLIKKSFKEFRRHRRFNADAFNVFFRQSDILNHFVRAVRSAEVEADLIETGFAEGFEGFFRSQRAVGV